MVFDPNDANRIFAGTHSSGVYVIHRQNDVAKGTEATQPVTGN
jgi:hypothetical protein